MNDKLLETIISYENYASFSEPYMQYSFLDLFSKADSKVYCDYIASSNFGKLVSASDYASYSTETVHVKFVEIRNLKKSEYEYRDGKYRTTVEFDKCLEYEDEIFTYLATSDVMIGGDVHIVMNFEYNEEEDKFFIDSINGSVNSGCSFPVGRFIVIERKNDRDELLKHNGKPVKFNVFNNAFIEGDSAPVFADEDIISRANIVASTDRYSKVNYSYKETRMRFKASFTAAPFSAYRVLSPIKFTSNKSFAYEGSVDLGYAVPLGARSKLAFYAGLGLSYSQLDLGVDDIPYGYELSDEFSFSYLRKYQLNSITEGLSFIDVLIPVYVSYELSCAPRVALSFDAGFKLYLNTNTRVHPYTVDGTVSTVYDGVIQNTTVLTCVIERYMKPASYMRNTYDLAIFGKFGVEYKIKERRYLFLKVGYTHGLTESYKSNLNEWFNSSKGIYPFVYSSKSDTDVAVRSFADCISYRRSALTFDIGFRMKF